MSAPTEDYDATRDPRSTVFETLTVGRLRAAASVDELARIWDEVRRLGGEQAWTENMKTMSQARARELEPNGPATPPAGVDPTTLPAQDPFAMIATATRQEDLSHIWELVTHGGTDQARWTAELGQYAQKRLEEINNAPSPAALNPFAAGLIS